MYSTVDYIREVTSVIDLLLNVDVVIVVVFIEVDLYDVNGCVCMNLARGQHGDEQGWYAAYGAYHYRGGRVPCMWAAW